MRWCKAATGARARLARAGAAPIKSNPQHRLLPFDSALRNLRMNRAVARFTKPKPTAPAARFDEPEPAATNSTAAGQRLAANVAGDNLEIGRDRAEPINRGGLDGLVRSFCWGGRGGGANWVRSNMFIS